MNSTRRSRKVLFLYSELASYVMACLSELASRPGIEIHVVHFPVNPEAPFQLSFPQHINFYDRSEFSSQGLGTFVRELNPALIYCSGWIDKEYLKVVRTLDLSIPVVLALDTPWQGTWRQRMAALLGSSIRNGFTHAWVAGDKQREYAIRLGFTSIQILKGVYSCDLAFFNKINQETSLLKSTLLPRRFLYVGRYVESKGVQTLWDAFALLQQEHPNAWELWCAGTGPLKERFPKHPQIKDMGFVQPENMPSLLANSSVFVLPSFFEPWGVVVHEFAAAGFPMVCSDAVGATEKYLISGVNGFSFRSGDVVALKNTLHTITQMPTKELLAMAHKSVEFANRYGPTEWADQLTNLL